MKAWVVTAACATILGLSIDVQAYCRTRTCDRNKENCQVDPSSGCVLTGNALFWPGLCTSYAVQRDGSHKRGISYDETAGIVQDAFMQWLEADCSDGKTPSLKIADLGPAECNKAQFLPEGANANLILFKDEEWVHPSSEGETLAITTVTYRPASGELLGADIEINSAQNNFAVGAVGPNDNDLASVITHEIGHFLGLAHSEDREATMYRSYQPGETALATLAPDDEAGICDAYPPDRTPKPGDCRPYNGFSTKCDAPRETSPSSSSCALARPPAPFEAATSAVLAVLFGLIARFRRLEGRRRRALPVR